VLLKEVSARIFGEVRGTDRASHDASSQPPAMIERR
jgi:GMP synthase PP-ATPase subunit